MASQTSHEPGQPEWSASDFARDQSEMLAAGFSFSGHERDLVCLNLGDGTFLDVSGVSGADSVSDGRAAVWADLDNDGDLDLFLRAVHGRSHFLFHNRVGQRRGWVRVTLRGTTSGPDAFGAVVRLGTSSGVQTEIKSGGSGFLSQSDPRLLFGLGDDLETRWLEVTWPSGETQRLPGPDAGSSVLLVEGDERLYPVAEPRFELPSPLSPEERAWRRLRAGRGGRVDSITVRDLDGRRLELQEAVSAEGATVVSFWATWCGPCAAEMPVLQRLADSGQHVIGLSVDSDATRGAIPSFAERHGVSYPLFTVDQAQLERLFTGRDVGIPLVLVLGPDLEAQELLEGWDPTHLRRLGDLRPALTDRDFRDFDHLNFGGAERLSRALARRLSAIRGPRG